MRLLVERLEPAKPRLIIFTFKKTAEVLLGRFQGSGFTDGFTLAGAPHHSRRADLLPARRPDRDIDIASRLSELAGRESLE